MGSTLTSVVLPISLAVVMFGLGLSLTVADFTRVRHSPRAVVVALNISLTAINSVLSVLTLPPSPASPWRTSTRRASTTASACSLADCCRSSRSCWSRSGESLAMFVCAALVGRIVARRALAGKSPVEARPVPPR